MLIALSIVLVVACGVLAFYRPVWGFIVGILLGAAVLILGLILDLVELAGGGPFIFLIAMIVLAFGPRREGARWPRIWARRVLSVLGSIAFVAFSFAIFGYGGSFGLFLVVLLISAAFSAIATSELNRATYIITTIGSSIRQNLPLPMALEMAATGLSDKREWIFRDIKKWLVEGYSLSESMRRGYPRCPGYAVALIAAGERIGQLPRAIAALEQDLVARAGTSKKVRHIPGMYPPLILFLIFIILFFQVGFVIPHFQAIISEMVEGAQLPAATRLLIGIADFFRSKTGGVFLLILFFAVLVGGIVYIRVRVRPRRPEKPYPISRIGDFIKWHLPFVRFYEWSRAMQRVTGMLRLSLNAGCTVNEAIKNTLQLDVNECFRKNLKQWLAMVERGEDIGQSAGQCGLGSGITWAFCEIDNHRNTLAVLDTLETSYRWAFSRAATLARFIIGPCETLCLGLIVGFVMYAIFAPMVAIIIAIGSFIP